ncbi:uncharacterized protein PV09_08193 [Verruconis gallopava]|uniref:Uncharacterized protein n=1 Tax=Verruconis gallopava TaxID=253628 RepID=A0A0D2A1V3_9PEZI|nr:uncharacterized protein PV09_08193 [Verruconis gallopava]KIW00305.1 hypothetical protein PV09_08193 [Verruconis gallopava]
MCPEVFPGANLSRIGGVSNPKIPLHEPNEHHATGLEFLLHLSLIGGTNYVLRSFNQVPLLSTLTNLFLSPFSIFVSRKFLSPDLPDFAPCPVMEWCCLVSGLVSLSGMTTECG